MASRESCRSPFRVVPNINTPAGDGGIKRSSSQDFAEQIRQLEKEGSKLMEATQSLGDSLLTGYKSTDAVPQTTSTSRASLSALTDITAEQRTIEQLRSQLDEQTREADRLSRHFLEDRSSHSRSSAPYSSQPTFGSNLASRLDIPTSTELTTGSVSPYLPQPQLEHQLREAHSQVNDLTERLREAQRISEQQKERFRASVEDMKAKLHEATVSRDRALEHSKHDTVTQDASVRRLQANMEQLQQTNRLQEQTLLQLNQKVETLQKDNFMVDTVMNQIRSLLLDREHKRGRSFYESEPLTRQTTTMLIHTLERCLQEMDAEIDHKQNSLTKVTLELEELKARGEERQNILVREQEDRIALLRAEYEQQLASLQESSESSKRQAAGLQEQISMLQHQSDQQKRLKDDSSRYLEDQLQRLRDDIEQERRSWTEKRAALELAVDESVRELAVVKGERDEAIRNAAAVESRFCDMQKTIERLHQELGLGQDQCHKLQERIVALVDKDAQMTQEIRGKTDLIVRLEKALDQVKQDAHAQLQQTLHNLEKEGKEQAAHEINKLATQLNAVTEKCHKLTLDLEVTKSEHKHLQERYSELKESHDKGQAQLQCELGKKEHMNEMLKGRLTEMEKMASDRDHYYRLTEEKNAEISALRNLRDKLTVQLEEREKNFLAVQEQNEKMCQMSDVNTQTALSLREEREHLLQRLNEKTTELEDTKRSRETLMKKLKMQDKHLDELEEDNVKLAEELKDAKCDIDGIVKEKDSLFSELRQSRYEVSNLQEDKEEVEKRLSEQEAALNGETHRLTERLKATERDLKLARKALKTVEEVDGRAVKVAGKMQKQVTAKRGEIDSLQSKMRWLEECLDAALKEKKLLQEDTEKVSGARRRGEQQNERLSAQLKNYKGQNQELRDKVTQLQLQLDKSSAKMASSQAQAQRYEQDVARLQLQHKLQLKELERTGQVKKTPQTSNKLTASPRRARALTTSSRSNKSASSRSKSADQEHPVRQKPSQADVEAFAAENGVGAELKKLLEEMRTLVYNQPHRFQHTTSYDAEPENSEQELHRTHETSTGARKSRKDSRSRTREKSDKSPNKSDRDRAESPVSELLVTPMTTALDDLSEASFSDSESLPHSPVRRAHQSKGVNKINTDAQQLCRRLEKRIENLSKMGSHLQLENKEIAKMMKEQEKRMKKVKTQIPH